MLKIERVEIHGFKSFGDRAEVRLQEGITAVVGPNGCGKSNIGDAIHWVLGEQSARTLRGGRMEDVIFAGTESRGPHGMAEVSLHLQSSNGDLPLADPTAIVTRRLFRSGDSEYLINGRKVRLRDIQEMLHAAHVGATTYAVIEQGKVDAILSAKPRERRHLIEEAAGIIGYKQKRRLAELKLQATEANLLRIHDVILEVRRQIGSLKRQAARARRYSRVRDELRGLEARILAARARALQADAARARRELAEVQALEAESAAALGRVEAELEAARESRRELETRTTSAREEMHRLSREIDREESTIRAESERAEAARGESARLEDEGRREGARLGELQAERAAREQALALIDRDLAAREQAMDALLAEDASFRALADQRAEAIEARRSEQLAGAARMAELSNTLGHLRRELQRLELQSVRLEEERKSLGAEAGALEERSAAASADTVTAAERGSRARGLAADARERSREAEERVRALADDVSGRREALARLDERVRSMEDVDKRLAGVGSGARWLLTRGQEPGVRGVVADFLEVDREAEAAVEGYLGPLLGAVVVPTSESAVTLIDDLRSARAGRCLFVTERPATESGTREDLPRDLLAEPGILGRLAESASSTNGIGAVLDRRLAGAMLVRDLGSAIDLVRRYPDHDYVTPAGEVVGRDGTIEGGIGERPEDGLLPRRRLLEATRAERDAAASSLERAEQARGRADADREAAALALSECERDLLAAEGGAVLAQERTAALTAEREKAARRDELLAQEISALQEERRDTEARLQATENDRAVFGAQLSDLDEDVRAHAEDLERLRGEASSRAERLADQRQERAAVAERRSHTDAEVSRLALEIAGIVARLQRDAALRAQADGRVEEAERASLESRRRLAQTVAGHAAAAAALASAESQLAASDRSSEGLEERAREARGRLDEIRERRREAETAAVFSESELRHLDERCRESLDEGMDAVLAGVPEEAGVELAVLEGEAMSLKAKLESMGPVNLLAIAEFRELEERHEFFLAQEKDLTGSMDSLKETIRRINRTSRERFLEAFEKVRTNFNETFRILFGGGRADIKLMEDEDPLECGLEIHVQPPGKRLQSLLLLSGGEKALSAIALLFAIFRFQPSPFCLLDEVDAALDETNVRRFTRMLREFSAETQFIVITHNKRSMEAADTLYGVTMEEPGISRIVSMSLS